MARFMINSAKYRTDQQTLLTDIRVGGGLTNVTLTQTPTHSTVTVSNSWGTRSMMIVTHHTHHTKGSFAWFLLHLRSLQWQPWLHEDRGQSSHSPNLSESDTSKFHIKLIQTVQIESKFLPNPSKILVYQFPFGSCSLAHRNVITARPVHNKDNNYTLSANG